MIFAEKLLPPSSFLIETRSFCENVGSYLLDCTAQNPRRHQESRLPSPWETQIYCNCTR